MKNKNYPATFIGLITVAISVSSGCSSTQEPQDTVAAQTDPAVLYSNNCALCHGPARQGTTLGPNITAGALGAYTDASLETFISSHQTGPNLATPDRAALAFYLKNTP